MEERREYVRKEEIKKEKTIDDRKKRSRQEIGKKLERKQIRKKANKKEQYEVYIMERQRSKSLCDERI